MKILMFKVRRNMCDVRMALRRHHHVEFYVTGRAKELGKSLGINTIDDRNKSKVDQTWDISSRRYSRRS